MGGYYRAGATVTFWIVFIGCYVYCIATYGFLLGLGLGWLPSGIAAAIAAVLWPLATLATALFFWIVFGR